MVGYPVLTVTEPQPRHKIHIPQNHLVTTGDLVPAEDETNYWILLGLKTLTKEGKVALDTQLTTVERRLMWKSGRGAVGFSS